jgi:hypothetical protein
VSKPKNTISLRAGTRHRPDRLDCKREILFMKKLLVLSVVICVGCSSAAFARGGGMGGMGGMGMHHSATTGGAFGTNPASPGTNSLGTALSGGGAGGAQKGPELGTGNPAVDREDARVAKMVGSICRGC